MGTETVRRALLVGINQYLDPQNNLKGCVNDVLLMGKVISENFGFAPEDIRLLTDKRATTANIRERLQWLVEGAGPGSVLLFHYSGHGSQVRDRDGDELDDALDEIICPYDLDWDDPFTDDEFAKAIKSIQDGVNFTLILDCCNSGTGTRQFFKEPGSRGKDTARYLVPPPDIGFRMAAGIELNDSTPDRTVNMVGRRDLPTRQFGSSLVDQNAILLSASRSDQTSADAWIDSDYRGAFTYSLVQTLQNKRYSLSYSDLIAGAGDWLQANSYLQVPQLETRQTMQGWDFLATGVPLSPMTTGARPSPAALLPGAQDTRVVFIHGITDHAGGYSDRWRSAFNRHLNLPLANFVEVAWDDLLQNPAPGAAGLQVLALNEVEQMRAETVIDELRELVESRHELISDLVGSNVIPDRTTERRLLSWLLNFKGHVGEFAKYLVSEEVRAALDARLISQLTPILQSGAPTVLITHSFGTVVAHHTLRSLPGMPRPALHCTLGSPLWMPAVRRELELDRRASGCDYWVNISAKGDLLGASLAGKFAVDEDHSVPAVGRGTANQSYFDHDNVTVQRDIVALAISRIASAR